MNSVERGRRWLQKLRELAGRSAWEWRRCPYCGQCETWKHGRYTPTAVVPGGQADRRGAAALAPALPTDLLGAVGAPGAGELVRQGGAAGGGGPLAVPGWVAAPDGGVAAELAWVPGALARVAAIGRRTRGAGALLAECEHRASLA